MLLLSELVIPRNGKDAVIQLLQGDLTVIPEEHRADIVVVSAYPGNYTISDKKTLIAAFAAAGLSVAALAADKDVDLLSQLACWLSKPLSVEQIEKFNFGRILCFEPSLHTKEPETIVGNIFRCINSFAFDEGINIIAMPVLASGNQKVPMEKMLPAILATAIFWLENGIPLDCIKLVLHSDAQVATAFPIFDTIKDACVNKVSAPVSEHRGIETVPPAAITDRMAAEVSAPPALDDYDLFISYAHTHSKLIESFVENFMRAKKGLRVFYDRSSIPPGGLWIKQISDAIQKAKKVLVFLSPDYTESPVCWDEFQCAKLME